MRTGRLTTLAALLISVGLVAGCGKAAPLTAQAAGCAAQPAQTLAILAGTQAKHWASDSFLVSAIGYNLDGSGRLRAGDFSRWDFTFMSASRSINLVVSIPGQGPITLNATAPVFDAIQPLTVGGSWKIDSDKAAALARKELGKTAPTDHVDRIELAPERFGGQLPRLTWQVIPDASLRSVYVDATDGTILD